MNTTDLPKFGIEIETVNRSRSDVARAIHSVVGGRLCGDSVVMNDGRVWKVVGDASLSGYLNGEIVSPILSYTDLDAVQSIVRAVREIGAKADDSCGIHIHVDGSRFDARSLLNLVNMVHKNERLIERALCVAAHRLARYTQSLDSDFIARLDARRPRSLADLQRAWYGQEAQPTRYDRSRYHGLNLNSLFYRGTIEFRYFNGTLHAGEVKAYVQFVLALANRALNAKQTSRARRVVPSANEKWAFRVFLKTLDMLGPDFKTARHHLLKNLTGSTDNPGRVRRATEPETTPTPAVA